MTLIIVWGLYNRRLQNPPVLLHILVPVIHGTTWSGNRIAHLASFFSFLSLHPLVIYNHTDNLVGMSSQLGGWMGQFAFSTICSISERIPCQHASKIYSMHSPDRANDRCLLMALTLPVISSSRVRRLSSAWVAVSFPSRYFTSCTSDRILHLSIFLV